MGNAEAEAFARALSAIYDLAGDRSLNDSQRLSRAIDIAHGTLLKHQPEGGYRINWERPLELAN